METRHPFLLFAQEVERLLSSSLAKNKSGAPHGTPSPGKYSQAASPAPNLKTQQNPSNMMLQGVQWGLNVRSQVRMSMTPQIWNRAVAK
jgi:hypothetical protein